jgi:hypothetical protein
MRNSRKNEIIISVYFLRPLRESHSGLRFWMAAIYISSNGPKGQTLVAKIKG